MRGFNPMHFVKKSICNRKSVGILHGELKMHQFICKRPCNHTARHQSYGYQYYDETL